MHTIINDLTREVINLKTKQLDPTIINVLIKEKLQDYLLYAIYSNPDFNNMVFIGGTALRKLHGLNRVSEDLDFVTENEIDYEKLAKVTIDYFSSIDLPNVSFSIQHGKNVSRLTIKFAILKEIGLSNLATEKLHVKIETTQSTILEDVMVVPITLSNNPMIIHTFNLNILMAGKMAACLNRVWKKGGTTITIKGRDYYDLLWYMGKGIHPNTKYLKIYTNMGTEEVFKAIDSKISQIKPADLFADLRFFFEDSNYIKNWCENFHKMYAQLRTTY